jgi:hypothetical protein
MGQFSQQCTELVGGLTIEACQERGTNWQAVAGMGNCSSARTRGTGPANRC